MDKPYNNIEEYKVYMNELSDKQADLYNLAISKITKEQYNTIMNKKYPDPFYRVQDLFIAAEMDLKEYFVIK